MIVTSSANIVGVSSVRSTTGVRGAAERISVAMEAAESPRFGDGDASALSGIGGNGSAGPWTPVWAVAAGDNPEATKGAGLAVAG
jgi:hypothetical protein